jgi:hypothetical protein
MFYREFRFRDGMPGVIIFTDNSKNKKTGDLVQTWIMRRDIDPIHAQQSGDDVSCCGDCERRPFNKDRRPEGLHKCYVTTHRAPLAIWRAYKRGSYQEWSLDAVAYFKGRKLRMGSYGDPALLPLRLYRSIVEGVSWAGMAGYTRQWKRVISRVYKETLMASAFNPIEALQAKKAGWRYFRGAKTERILSAVEKRCPAQNGRTECASCMACSPSKGRDRVIVEH